MRYRSLEHQWDGLQESLQEEEVVKENLGSQLGRAAAELATWKQKYEVEGVQRAEELEVAKLKLQVRITDQFACNNY